jgi:hypothetical protein
MQPTASDLLALRARETIYPGTAEHISAVRADLRPLLHDCPMADDVILCASELAANAAKHSNSRLPGGTFTVRAIVIRGDFIRIEVQDSGGPWTRTTTAPAGHHGVNGSLPCSALELAAYSDCLVDPYRDNITDR